MPRTLLSRRMVNVFWRADGRCLFDETWGTGDAPSVPKPASPSDGSVDARVPISASAIWSLVQVFVQFAREVDGGNVQRLVFRTTDEANQSSGGFNSGSSASTPADMPIVVHVAHDALFVVTIARALPPGVSDLQRSEQDDSSSLCFAQAVLDYFVSEQSSFLKSRGSARQSSESENVSPSQSHRHRRAEDMSGVQRVAQTGPNRSSMSTSHTTFRQASLRGTNLNFTYESLSSGQSSRSGDSDLYSQDSSVSYVENEGDGATSAVPLMSIDTVQISMDIHRIRAMQK